MEATLADSAAPQLATMTQAVTDQSSEVAVPLLTKSQGPCKRDKCSWYITVSSLLTLQLGWGLWMLPADYARLGWLPATVVVLLVCCLTTYSGLLFTRLCQHTPGCVMCGDVGYAAFGRRGRAAFSSIIYVLDATRCVVMHLAATRSLQAAVGRNHWPLVYYAAAVGMLVLVLGQYQSLRKLSNFFLLGTSCQMVALGIVVYDLLTHPDREAKHVLANTDNWMHSCVAVANIFFAFGGQFAYVELQGAMKQPQKFPSAVSTAASIMTSAYLGLGVVGYRSKGASVDEVVVFSIASRRLGHIAAALLLVQATAQYLCNLNVWAFNIATLIASPGNGTNAGHHSYFTTRPTAWFLITLIIASYSLVIAVWVPFFSALVGLLVSGCYLTCAYTLPCMFTLKLLGDKLSWPEKVLCWLLVPASMVFSAVGLYCSLAVIGSEIASGGSVVALVALGMGSVGSTG